VHSPTRLGTQFDILSMVLFEIKSKFHIYPELMHEMQLL
jgi:hypothetical protein